MKIKKKQDEYYLRQLDSMYQVLTPRRFFKDCTPKNTVHYNSVWWLSTVHCDSTLRVKCNWGGV